MDSGSGMFQRSEPASIVIFFANESGPGAGVTDGPTPEQRAELGSVGLAAGLGCSVVASLILLIGGGVALDRVFATTPLLTLAGVGLGLVVAGYQLYELSRVGLKDRSPGPLGQRLARVSGRRAEGPSRDSRTVGEE